MPPSVLVTGATGFLGRHVGRELLAAGYRVRGLTRSTSAPLDPAIERHVIRSFDDRAGTRAALAGVDAVVHLAARVHVMNEEANAQSLAAFRQTNVEGTRMLLDDSITSGVGQFLFVSSVKAMGEGGERRLTEMDTAAPLDPYGISKLEAEELVRTMSDDAGVRAPIIRLPLVYGPGVRANFLRLITLVDRGVPLPFGSVRNRRSLAFTGNVTAAIRSCLESTNAARETFLISDGKDLSTPELIREIASALGRQARLIPVPLSLFRGAGKFGDVVVRGGFPSPITSAAVDRLLGSFVVDSTKLGRVTGYRPPFSVTDGVRATIAWYQSLATTIR